jgi:hypothetical protein
LETILTNFNENEITNFDFFKKNFKGFFINNQTLYLFFDISDLDIQSLFIENKNTIWFGISDEILNHNLICNFPFSNFVCDFFYEHLVFLLMFNNKTNDYFELPTIAYCGNEWNKCCFESIFGVPKKQTLFGNFYVLNDYFASIKNAIWADSKEHKYRSNKRITYSEEIKYIDGGIIRFAIFPGKMNLVLKKESIDLWFNNYDSLYINDYLENRTSYILKNYNQQVPLSFHRIDTLNAEISNDFDYYYIM